MATAARITFFFFLFLNLSVAQNVTESGAGTLSVGVILNLQSLVGKMARISILMAMEDFYAVHRNYSTKLVLHIRDSNGDDIQAVSEGTFYNLWIIIKLYIEWNCETKETTVEFGFVLAKSYANFILLKAMIIILKQIGIFIYF